MAHCLVCGEDIRHRRVGTNYCTKCYRMLELERHRRNNEKRKKNEKN